VTVFVAMGETPRGDGSVDDVPHATSDDDTTASPARNRPTARAARSTVHLRRSLRFRIRRRLPVRSPLVISG
jgi:hypothetical protein